MHISHIRREGNSLANAFANIGVVQSEGFYWNGIHPLPPNVEDIIKLDTFHGGFLILVYVGYYIFHPIASWYLELF